MDYVCPYSPPCTPLLTSVLDLTALPDHVCAPVAVVNTANFALNHLQLPLSPEASVDPARRLLVGWASLWPLACGRTARAETVSGAAHIAGAHSDWVPGLDLPIEWLGLVVTHRAKDGYARLFCPMTCHRPDPGSPNLLVRPTVFAPQPIWAKDQWRFTDALLQLGSGSVPSKPLLQAARALWAWYTRKLLHRPVRTGRRPGSGTWHGPEDFLNAVRTAAAVLRSQRHQPTEKAVAQFFSQSSDPHYPKCDERRLREWKDGYFPGVPWEQLIAADTP